MINNRFRWRTAFAIAWRELRASKARFLFVILAIAVGVGALTGVRGFSGAFRSMLLKDARRLMAADITVRIFGLPSAQQVEALQALEHRGVRRTWITETFTMASSAAVREPLLVCLKAVDPAAYPFYGAVRLEPPGSLRQELDSRSAVVSEDLLIRLKVAPGEQLRIGGQEFRIAALLAAEPDRMTGSLNVGPRVMISRQGLDRTGLIRTGSRAAERFLLRLPEGGANVEEVRKLLKRSFPESTIADFRETHPIITRGLNRATMFLSLVSLIAVIVGALGVGMAMHAHLQQHMDTVAILKCLGAQSRQILRIYALQALLLGTSGGLLGVGIGALAASAFPALIARYFQFEPAVAWDAAAAAQGLGIAALTALLFTLPALLGIRAIRPAAVFRREMAETRPGLRERWRGWRAPAVAAGVIAAAIGLLAAWLSGVGPRDSLRLGAYFLAALLAGLSLLAGIAWLLLRALRSVLRIAAHRLPAALRHGMANLYRPGNHAQAVLVALGVGVMFTLTAYLLQRSLLVEIMESAPPGMPNVFLLDIPAQQRQDFVRLVSAQPGVERPPEVFGAVSLRLARVDGMATEQIPRIREWGRRYLRATPVTWMGPKPPDIQVLEGDWWRGATPQLCAEHDAARILNVKPGSRMEWTSLGRGLAAQVACVFRSDSLRLAARFDFIFNPGTLDGFPAVHYGSMRVRPADVPALQRAAYERYPTVTVINVAEVLSIVQQVVDQIAVVVRFISGFTILAGVIILASSVAGTRFRRLREVVILKTLGATRKRVMAIFSMEFLLLGIVAGLMGSILATAFAALVSHRLLNAGFRFDPWPNLVSIAGTAFIAVAAGWLASWRILRQKPLEILRQE